MTFYYVYLVALVVVLSVVLFNLAQSKKDRRPLFFVLLTLVSIALIATLYNSHMAELLALPFWIVACITLLIIVERGFWMSTLYKVAGEDKYVWFLIIFTIPLIGWLLYYATELR